MTQTLEKRSSESIFYSIDCSDLVDASETISSITSIADDSSTLIFGTPAVSGAPTEFLDGRTVPAGQVVIVQISGGTPGSAISTLYTIRCKFVTSESNRREATVLLRVKDRTDV